MSSSDSEPETHEALALTARQQFVLMFEDLASGIPPSSEPLSAKPIERASEIVRVAGLKAGATSAGLALASGPMGMLTVIPDLLKVWQIQQQMVADVAACFGKSAYLNRQMMVYCLFRHGAAMLLRDVVARVGQRVIVKQASLRVVQQILRRIGVQVTQKAVGKTLSRWLPIVGPIVIGGYTLIDTRNVGKTAIDTFNSEIEIEPAELELLALTNEKIRIIAKGECLMNQK